MTNREKYEQVFIECFAVEKDKLNDEFVYQCVPAWDSVGHMGMIAALEDTFGIAMEVDDIIELGSFTKGIAILAKYDVSI